MAINLEIATGFKESVTQLSESLIKFKFRASHRLNSNSESKFAVSGTNASVVPAKAGTHNHQR
jgi:hypothetical protein